MKLLILATVIMTAIASPCTPSYPVCPTVTTTAVSCPTCILNACLILSTISDLPGCPTPVPTETASYPCDGPCPTGCAGTSYIYEGGTGPTEPTACPTVTSTREVCGTCQVLGCLAYSTISSVCGCPSAVPTVEVAYPCEGGECPAGCATTEYVYATEVPSCG